MDDSLSGLVLTDVAMHDIFAVNFCICMRPVRVIYIYIHTHTYTYI
jgi:hypothetical protein